MCQPALAARLATPPIYSVGQSATYSCSIEYLGQSTVPIRITIAARLFGSPRWQVRRSVKAGAGNTNATAFGVCQDGARCGPFVCVFTFTGSPVKSAGRSVGFGDWRPSAPKTPVSLADFRSPQL
jgi:hypothetical protein